MIHEITSANNPRYKIWLKLLESRGIKKNELALLVGKKIILEVAEQFPHRIVGVITQREKDVISLSLPDTCPIYLVPQELFACLDIYGIKEPILIITAPSLPLWDGKLLAGLSLFLPFQNPINLGTTIRSAAALGVSIILLKEAATPYLPKSLRASGPAVFQVPLLQGPSLEELSRNTDIELYALSPHGKSLYSFSFPQTIGLVAGIEGPGLDNFWPLEKRLSIPMNPYVESLNAAVAASIAMAFYKEKT